MKKFIIVFIYVHLSELNIWDKFIGLLYFFSCDFLFHDHLLIFFRTLYFLSNFVLALPVMRLQNVFIYFDTFYMHMYIGTYIYKHTKTHILHLIIFTSKYII